MVLASAERMTTSSSRSIIGVLAAPILAAALGFLVGPACASDDDGDDSGEVSGCIPSECEANQDPVPGCTLSSCDDLPPACEGRAYVCFEGCVVPQECPSPVDAGSDVGGG